MKNLVIISAFLLFASQAQAASVTFNSGTRLQTTLIENETSINIETRTQSYNTLDIYQDFNITEAWLAEADYEFVAPSTDKKAKINGAVAGFGGGIYTYLSGRKLLNQESSTSVVKDYTLRLDNENGYGMKNIWYYGAAVNFRVPGTNALIAEIHAQDDKDTAGTGTNYMLIYSIPMSFGIKHKASLSGYFLGSIVPEGSSNPFVKIKPRVRYDLGNNIWGQPNKLKVGLVYDYFQQQGKLKDEATGVVEDSERHTVQAFLTYNL